MLISVLAIKFKRPKICLFFHIKLYLFWTLYCEQLRLNKRKVKLYVLIEIFLIRLIIMPSFRYRLQVIVMFCGSTGGNSPGRFRPAITLHIEQLSPAAKHLVTKKKITKQILNNVLCIVESSVKIRVGLLLCTLLMLLLLIFDWTDFDLNWSYIFDSHYFIEINLDICDCTRHSIGLTCNEKNINQNILGYK